MKLLIPILPGVLGQFSFMSPMHTSFNAATDTLGIGNQYHTERSQICTTVLSSFSKKYSEKFQAKKVRLLAVN